ncbi:MAG: ABC transporter substrate-binding protein [Proteobacteria bacterium]|nr:ABC transporter substrate-binding protein [Pseudomonadota bacterium]
MLKRHTFPGLAILLLAAFSIPAAVADSVGTPGTFITNLAQTALASANDRTLSATERQRGLDALLDTGFDLPQIAAHVVGPYWLGAGAAERQAFTMVFRDYVGRTYSQRFADYDSASFRVVSQHAAAAASTVVTTEIDKPLEAKKAGQTSPNQPQRFDWLVVSKGGYRVVDVTAGGVSMAATMRAEFTSYLRHHGGDLTSLTQRLQATAIALK